MSILNIPKLKYSNNNNFLLIAGPCVIENESLSLEIASKICHISEKLKLPFQRLASSRYTGTDTDAFAYSNGGVPSALISLPLRYMHTTVEMVQKEDVEGVIRMIYETLKRINPNKKYDYFSS